MSQRFKKYLVFGDLNGLPNPGEKTRFSRSICQQREEKLPCTYFKFIRCSYGLTAKQSFQYKVIGRNIKLV